MAWKPRAERAASGEFLDNLGLLVGKQHDREALLRPRLRNGRPVAPEESPHRIWAFAADQIACLPGPLKRLDAFRHPVEIAPGLRQSATDLDRAAAATIVR